MQQMGVKEIKKHLCSKKPHLLFSEPPAKTHPRAVAKGHGSDGGHGMKLLLSSFAPHPPLWYELERFGKVLFVQTSCQSESEHPRLQERNKHEVTFLATLDYE